VGHVCVLQERRRRLGGRRGGAVVAGAGARANVLVDHLEHFDHGRVGGRAVRAQNRHHDIEVLVGLEDLVGAVEVVVVEARLVGHALQVVELLDDLELALLDLLARDERVAQRLGQRRCPFVTVLVGGSWWIHAARQARQVVGGWRFARAAVRTVSSINRERAFSWDRDDEIGGWLLDDRPTGEVQHCQRIDEPGFLPSDEPHELWISYYIYYNLEHIRSLTREGVPSKVLRQVRRVSQVSGIGIDHDRSTEHRRVK